MNSKCTETCRLWTEFQVFYFPTSTIPGVKAPWKRNQCWFSLFTATLEKGLNPVRYHFSQWLFWSSSAGALQGASTRVVPVPVLASQHLCHELLDHCSWLGLSLHSAAGLKKNWFPEGQISVTPVNVQNSSTKLQGFGQWKYTNNLLLPFHALPHPGIKGKNI